MPSSIPLYLGSDDSYPCWTRISFFFKWGSPPGAATALFSAKSGLTATLQVISGFAGDISVQAAYRGAHANILLNPALSTTVERWYWLSVVMGTSPPTAYVADNHNGFVLGGQLSSAGGLTDGVKWAGAAVGGIAAESLPFAIGWGVDVVGNLAEFPNASGSKMAVLQIETDPGLIAGPTDAWNRGPAAIPTAEPDPTAAAMKALYLCHEPAGAATIIHDATSGGYDLAQGAQGATIVRDSPFT